MSAIMDAFASLQQLTKRYVTLPLEDVKTWSQKSTFKIDALGLVTLLGADEVNGSVGHLQRRRYTEYLPLLAAFVIAGNRFTAEQPGFVIYNLTDGITSTELKGWFSRWLMSQTVNNATTILEWKPRDKHSNAPNLIAPALSFVLVTPLLVCAILIGDWYGVGNAFAIIISIFVRVYLLWQLREARDEAATPKPGAQKPEPKTLCIIRSDGKMVTVKAPGSVLSTFTNDCEVKYKMRYKLARRIGWLALGVHMCILGMCTLFTQIYTVLLLVFSTWALCSDWDFDIGRKPTGQQDTGDFTERRSTIPFNDCWIVEKTDHAKKKGPEKSPIKLDRRLIAWARIQPTETEETMMKRWNLLPYEENREWWEEYKTYKKSFRQGAASSEKPPVTPLAQAHGSRPPVTPLAQAHGSPAPMTTSSSQQPLLNPSTLGTSGSSVGGTPTEGASRSSSPGAALSPRTTQADPASSV